MKNFNLEALNQQAIKLREKMKKSKSFSVSDKYGELLDTQLMKIEEAAERAEYQRLKLKFGDK